MRRTWVLLRALRLKWRPVEYVVWGGRDFDFWVGSPEDLRRQRQLRMLAASTRFRQSFMPIGAAFGKLAADMGIAAGKIVAAFGKMAPVMREQTQAELLRDYYDQKG